MNEQINIVCNYWIYFTLIFYMIYVLKFIYYYII